MAVVLAAGLVYCWMASRWADLMDERQVEMWADHWVARLADPLAVLWE